MLTRPRCGGETRVINSHRIGAARAEKARVRVAGRRRKCLSCGYRANTLERWEDAAKEIARSRQDAALRDAKTAASRMIEVLDQSELLPPIPPGPA